MKLAILAMKTSTPEHFSNPRTAQLAGSYGTTLGQEF